MEFKVFSSLKKLLKRIILPLKFEKYFDLISYTHTYLNNKVASYPILWNMDNLKLIKKVLILAPHPDDEIFGMGGTIIKLKKLGASIKIVWMTNADNEVRKKEASKILNLLNIKQSLEEAFPIKGKHFLIDEGKEVIKKELEIYKPHVIFLPSIFDSHHDHVRLNLSLRDVLKEHKWNGKIMQYEVWNTLIPNVLIDISDVVKEKEKMMKIYQSQLQEPKRCYVERILCLNKYRGLPYCIDYAEGFILYNSKDKYLKVYRR